VLRARKILGYKGSLLQQVAKERQPRRNLLSLEMAVEAIAKKGKTDG